MYLSSNAEIIVKLISRKYRIFYGINWENVFHTK